MSRRPASKPAARNAAAPRWALLLSLWLVSGYFIAPLARATLAELTERPVPPAAALGTAAPCDFVMFWAAGRMAAAGQAAQTYRPGPMLAAERLNKSAPGLQLPWVYPPPALLLARLTRPIPFVPAFFIWSFGLTGATVLLLRLAALPWPAILGAALSPAALLNADLGQLGLVTGAALLAGFTWAQHRPGRAGALFGLLVIKPQLALLAPLAFLRRGQRAGLCAGGLAGLALCALSLLAFGPDAWRNYLAHGLPVSRFLLVQPFPRAAPGVNDYEFYEISVFCMLRSFGCNLAAAGIGQALAALLAAWLCWRAWGSRHGDPLARAGFCLCLGLLATPYGYLYDLCGACAAIAALAWRERRLGLADILLWTWPVLGLTISLQLHLELAPLVIGLAARRCRAAMLRPIAAPGSAPPPRRSRSSAR